MYYLLFSLDHFFGSVVLMFHLLRFFKYSPRFFISGAVGISHVAQETATASLPTTHRSTKPTIQNEQSEKHAISSPNGKDSASVSTTGHLVEM